jgi:flagellar protein FliS
MSAQVQAALRYRQTEVTSRTPLELVVMLYDGALRFIAQAREAVERGDIPSRRNAVSRAMSIVSELQSTLKLEEGGAVAESLDGLYSFVMERLIAASFKKQTAPLDEATQVLTVLRDAWSTLASQESEAALKLAK